MDANKDQTSILGNAKPSQAIVKLALPTTLALLAKAVYNIVDAAYIGMLGSDIALTAVGVTVPLLLIMVSIENIFAAGAAVLAGRQLGPRTRRGQPHRHHYYRPVHCHRRGVVCGRHRVHRTADAGLWRIRRLTVSG